MMSIWVLLGPITMVCVIAIAMAICSAQVPATQFAIYMSIANLGASLGSASYGLVAERTSFIQSLVLIGSMTLINLAIVLTVCSQLPDFFPSRYQRCPKTI